MVRKYELTEKTGPSSARGMGSDDLNQLMLDAGAASGFKRPVLVRVQAAGLFDGWAVVDQGDINGNGRMANALSKVTVVIAKTGGW